MFYLTLFSIYLCVHNMHKDRKVSWLFLEYLLALSYGLQVTPLQTQLTLFMYNKIYFNIFFFEKIQTPYPILIFLCILYRINKYYKIAMKKKHQFRMISYVYPNTVWFLTILDVIQIFTQILILKKALFQRKDTFRYF